MKKVLPILIVVLIGLLLVGGAFWFLRGLRHPPAQEGEEEEEVLRELPLEEQPYVSLTPRADGHEFHMEVTGIPSGLDTMEYELVYQNAQGITQGVPGSINLEGKRAIERDLLLGSCSAGKCKYDEGVEEGTFTLRFRDEKGRLISKLETGFHLQEDPREIASTDGKFSLTLTRALSGFYLTMSTFGLPQAAPGDVTAGPYGVFTSSRTSMSGTVDLSGTGTLYGWNGSRWVELSGGSTSFLGTFVRVSD